jgi:hypothetical protein
MSAGIISACLPTLGPVLSVFFRALGIKRSLLGSKNRTRGTGGGTGATGAADPLSSTNNLGFANLKSAPASLSDRTEVELEVPPAGGKSVTKKGSARGPFYRLPDEYVSESSGDAAARPVDANLRPDHGCAYTVTTSHGRAPRGNMKGLGDGESWSGDDVPLRGIRVHTDFTQSAS